MTEAAARGAFAPRAAAVMNHATILPPSVREVPNECEAEGVYPVGSRHSRAAAVVQTLCAKKRRGDFTSSFLAQRQGFAPLAARPGEQPTGLFSLRRADLSTNNSRANRLLPQTPPPSNPCHIRVTQNGADQSRLRFPWRRDRDLNPGRHHCLTRFRIVRVQPLRHLCIDGRRAPEMQTSFYRKSAKKATDFAPSQEIFCWMLHFLPPSMREVARCPRLALGNVTEGVYRITSKTPSVSLRSTASRAVETALDQEMARPMCHFQVRKRSKPHRGFAKKALSHPHGRSQEGHRFPCF